MEQCYHQSGLGRPPRNPSGIFRAFLTMRMKGVRSLRKLTRMLDIDKRIRKICFIKENQKGYTRSVMSRFSKRVRQDNLNKIIDQKVIDLLKSQQTTEVDVFFDAFFIKSLVRIRNPSVNQIGFSDNEAIFPSSEYGLLLFKKLVVV